MKLPNGYGSIVKLSGKRRNQYGIYVTTGWTDEGKQIRKILGYAKSRTEGYQMLADYHNDPYDIDLKNISFEELYNKWYNTKKDSWSKTSKTRYSNAFKYFKGFHNKPFISIKLNQLEKIIKDCPHGYDTKKSIKLLYSQMYDYAKKIDVPIKKNYSEFLDIGQKEISDKHNPFADEEINKLWNNLNIDYVGSILIMIYTGLRPTELLTIKEIHLEDRYMIGGIKTKAGIDRIIPINEKIVHLIQEYLLSDKLKITNDMYRTRFDNVMKELQMNHLPHDGRHTFATLMDRANANKICIKKIMGHSINDITDGVYTHKEIKDLLDAVNLI